MGEVWILSGITQYENRIGLGKQLHCMWSVEFGNITREALKDKLYDKRICKRSFKIKSSTFQEELIVIAINGLVTWIKGK